MAVENHSIGDGKVSISEAKRLLREAVELQKVLVEIKLHLEDEAG